MGPSPLNLSSYVFHIFDQLYSMMMMMIIQDDDDDDYDLKAIVYPANCTHNTMNNNKITNTVFTSINLQNRKYKLPRHTATKKYANENKVQLQSVDRQLGN